MNKRERKFCEQNPMLAGAVVGSGATVRTLRDPRNQKCACGSGKRMKVCCLHKQAKRLKRIERAAAAATETATPDPKEVATCS